MVTGLEISRPPIKTGIEISDDWSRDFCRLVEKSLTTGLGKTIPYRYLKVTNGNNNGLGLKPDEKQHQRGGKNE